MAETTGTTEATEQQAVGSAPFQMRHLLFGALAWLVPGLGHLVQKRWDRAAIFFFSIAAMAGLGLAMGAKLYVPPFGGDQGLFVTVLHGLSFIADVGAGLLFPVSWLAGFGRIYLDRASGDYGTVFFLCAGLLNMLTVLDAYDISRGRKN